MSIRTKFTIFIFFMIILIIAGVAISVFFTQSVFLKEQFEENRKKLLKDIIYTCQEAVVVKDELLVINTIKSIIETYKPQIVYAGYLSPTGIKIIFSRDKEKENEFIDRIFAIEKPTLETFVVQYNNEQVTEFGDILKDKEGKYYGCIKIGFSQTYLNEQIEKATFLVAKKILNISIIALLISLILVNLLTILMIKPIKILTKAAVELGSGNLDVKTNIKGKDEIGILGKTFDEMAQKVKQLDELKDSFVSSVSHELRSPLSAIDGYVDYLIDGLQTGMPLEKQQKALNIIKDSVNRLTGFINNILDLAKIKAGKFELHKISTRVEDVSLEIVALFEQLAKKQEKTLKLEIEENLPSIDADPERLKQVITNLVGNALKFTDAGATITVKARLVTEKVLSKGYKHPINNAAGNYVEISVIDTGWGIPENELDKVFEKFYQVGGATPKKPKGTGLGLSIAAEIVKFHNGEIGVESVLGKGTTFKFVIPVFKTK